MYMTCGVCMISRRVFEALFPRFHRLGGHSGVGWTQQDRNEVINRSSLNTQSTGTACLWCLLLLWILQSLQMQITGHININSLVNLRNLQVERTLNLAVKWHKFSCKIMTRKPDMSRRARLYFSQTGILIASMFEKITYRFLCNLNLSDVNSNFASLPRF
jgi:hypothetical protein